MSERSRRKSPEQRAAEIRSAACALATEAGLTALTLRAVARRASVTPALVAHYEPSMEALVTSTFSTLVSDELAHIESLVANEPNATAKLALLIATVLEPARDDLTVVWLDAWSLGRRSPPLADAVRAHMDAWQEFAHRLIDEGVASGVFSTPEPALVAWQLLGMIDGLNAHALVGYRDERARDALIARAVERELGLAPGNLARHLGDVHP